MAIDSDNRMGTFEMYCDSCEEYELFDTDGDFKVFIAEAKELGWTMKKENGTWTHKCPECSKEI